MKPRNIIGALALSILCLVGAGFATPAHAQLNTGLNEVGQTIKLSAEDPRIIASRIINVVLGVLGIIMLTLMLYAGFLWMTAGGDAEKIKKAQSYIRNAVIGLVIILSAWAITYYVINVLLNATGGVGGGGGSGGGGGGGGGIGGGANKTFRIASATPQGDDKNPYNTNSKINITFTQEISPDISKDWPKYVQVTQNNTVVEGTWEVVGNNAQWIRFTPAVSCVEDPSQKCFSKNTLFSVIVNKGTFISANKELISCSGLYPACDFKFFIGDRMDTQAPAVTITDVYDYQSFCEDVPYISIPAKAVDDVGVSIMQWLEDEVAWDSDGPTSQPTPKAFSSAKDWSTVGKILKKPYALSVRATDLDSNIGSQTVHLTVLKNHCCNKKQDADEIGLDCGGADCLSCGGGTCTGNEQCSSGLCQEGVCVDHPVITNISPTSGKDGTFVSIWGGNFGSSGTTTFLGQNPPGVEAFAPQACTALNVKTWSNEYILVEVPKGAQTGPIKVYNNQSKLFDTTDSGPGPILPKFEVNDVIRPGICKIDPESGKSGIKATLTGNGFGGVQNNRVIGFGAKTVIQQASWSNESISFTVPSLYAGWFMTGLKDTGGEPLSNAVPFNLQGLPPVEAPVISAVTPDHGPTGQYITILGQHFGTVQGLVKFVDKVTNNEIVGDVNFPAECGSGWWTDTQIIVKVPKMVDQQGVQIQPLNPGAVPNFKLYVERSGGGDVKQSNRVDFLFSNESLGPGICRISPTAGPRKTVVQIYGERFGATQNPSDGAVFAKDALASTYSGWSSQQIDAMVPDAAVTGKLYVKSGPPPISNEVQFLVGDCRDLPNICTGKQICCPGGTCADDKCPATSFQAMYGWEMTTGIIPRAPSVVQNCKINPQPGDLIPPSPSPWDKWPGGENVCVGQSKMGVLFNMPIEGTSAELQNKFKLMQCVGKDTDPCQGNQARVPVTITGLTKQTNHLNGNVICSQPPDAPDCMDYVTFEPTNDLVKNGIYEVYVSSDIKSLGQYGDTMAEAKTCAEPGSGYCYRFKVGTDDSACQVGFVYMSPYSMTTEGQSVQRYEALPVGKDAVCSLLSCKGFDWEWSTTWKGIQTSLANLVTPLALQTYKGQTHVSCVQKVQTGDLETPDEPVHVNAVEKMSTVQGYGELYIKYLTPQVIDHSPDCGQACLNAYAWARFNTSLLPSSVNGRTVQVFECVNENCLPSDLVGKPNLSEKFNFQIKLWPNEGNLDSKLLSGTFGTSTVNSNSFILIDPRDYVSDPNNPKPALVLKENTYYVVRLVGAVPDSIVSKNGSPMPQDFVWKFRTATGEKAYCAPDRVSVYPTSAIEQRIGDRELFQAKVFSAPDECRSDGQMLLVTNDFIWSFVTPQQVAKYSPFPPPKHIDTDGALPKGCTSQCLLSGAEGVYGETAKCGNGIVETTDPNYCNAQTKKTLAGQNCKLLPVHSGAGEQCDGDLSDPMAAACNQSTCLWMNTSSIFKGGSCGNFDQNEWQKGKMCDPGLRCFGATEGTIPSGTPCDSPNQTGNVSSVDCVKAGGKCEIRDYNGCSVGCKNLGSSSVQGSECGNGSVGYGEDCDQGSNNGFSGCSVECLHKGSSNTVNSLCGNGALEAGENCESSGPGEPVPAYCDKTKCLKLGNSNFETKTPPDPTDGACGNGFVDNDKGEDCDDKNHLSGDGCSPVCLREGSSWMYPKDGSGLCGNGLLEKGEACEAQKGNGLLDPIQIGEIIGIGQLDENKIKKTQLSVKYSNIQTEATFGVRCGNVEETDCGADGASVSTDYGLDKDGCCSYRPKKVVSFPQNASTDVCRNTLIKVEFDQPMDAASVQSSFILAKETNEVKCPDGTVQLSEINQEYDGWWPWLKRSFQKLVSWIKGEPAHAGIWCANMVAGQLTSSSSTKEFFYTLQNALEPKTRYIVRFNGDKDLDDNDDMAKRFGIKSKDGVVVMQDYGDLNSVNKKWDYTWWFETGNEICRINGIMVEDLDPDHPTYFQKAFEAHAFRGSAMSLHNGKVELLSPVEQYNWKWWGWLSNTSPVADVVGNDFTVNGAVSESTVAAKDKNGSAIIYAGLEVTSDTIDGAEKLSQSQVIFGALPVMVFVCENPWPELSKAPFRDMKGSKSLDQTIFKDGPYFNFQTMYCRDGENGLLPELEAHPIPLAPIDQMQGILRQYLFTFKEPAYKHDGIGIRVMSNLYHDSLLDWYKRQGFSGAPQQIKIDGYEALRDAGTVYIGFANTDIEKGASNIYQNILVISRNLDDMAETTRVFDQMVESLAFNINFENDNTNVCTSNGLPVQYSHENKKSSSGFDLIKGEPISCVSDWDCLVTGDSRHCASYKLKLQRDLIRLKDFAIFKNALKGYYDQKGFYPQMNEGSFLYGKTNSRWPSWVETFGKALGMSEQIPVDPVNRYISCGSCVRKSDNVQTGLPCTTADDCPSGDYACEAQDGFDPQTCWNTANRQFKCPLLDASAQSNFYIYNSIQGGRRFELGSNFELPPPPNQSDLKNWWYPEYQPTIKVCYTSSTISDGRECQTDDDCKPCTNPYDTNACKVAKGPTGSCRVLGTFLYNNICNGNAYGEGGVCGDKVIGNLCFGGEKNGQACKLPSDCPGGQCKQELCELGQTHPAACVLAGNKPGTKLQVCNGCMDWVDDPKISVCHENAFCGNGRIDKICEEGKQVGLTCSSNDDCKDDVGPHACVPAQIGTPPHSEVCDDGALNGTYGHCNLTCTGIDKFCGNQKLDPGEKCDRGISSGGNGAWCNDPVDCYFYLNDPSLKGVTFDQSCSLDCQSNAPFCGDGQTFPDPALEECDGSTLVTSGKLCVSLPVNDKDKWEKPCVENIDCGSSALAKCGGDEAHKSCADVKVGRCATAAKICVSAAKLPVFQQAAWFNMTNFNVLCNTGNDCAQGEQCLPLADAGGDQGGCKSDVQCQAGNVVGKCMQYDTAHVRLCNKPGTPNQCKYEVKWSNCKPQHSCGDGVLDAGEECDDGDKNADFGSCTSLCKKNVCGDGNLHLNVEECDKGSMNGKQSCQAQYQSSCNDCSLQCKNLTASGGYCGNGVKEGNEQCDGNDVITSKTYNPSAMTAASYINPHYILQADLTDIWSLPEAKVYVGALDPKKEVVKVIKSDVGNITCKSLGYDFAIDSLVNAAIYVNNPLITLDSGPKGLFVNYWGSEAQAIHDQIAQNKPPRILNLVKVTNDPKLINKYQDNALLNTIFDVCGLIKKEKADDGIYDFIWKEPDEWPSKQEFWSCVSSFGSKYGFQVVGEANSKPSCGLDCQIGGCGRCIEEGGTAKLDGTVYIHGGNGGVTVGGARVTLQYQGLNVSQVFTDAKGHFEFQGINNRAQCGAYRLVAERYSPEYVMVKSVEFSAEDYASKVKAEVCDSVDQCAMFDKALVFPSSILGQEKN